MGVYGDGKESVFMIMLMENKFLFSEYFPRSVDWDLAWGREVVKTSIRAPLSVACYRQGRD